MSTIIRLLSLNNGAPTPFDGGYLLRYDPDTPGVDANGNPMIATIEVTHEKSKALHFSSAADAIDYYRRPCSPPHDRRWDGELNRPLTAFNIEITGDGDEA